MTILRNPTELANKMAQIANQIKHLILLNYQHEDNDGKIHHQLNNFRIMLIDTLTIEQFADMVAQTICYGLFAAKCSISQNFPINEETMTFSRLTAIYFIPKTNPFLRNLFNQIAGNDLDDRLIWAVDHLIAVLNHADLASILADFGQQTGREDPVVHFYELFLAHYDPKLREIHGIYYTPEPVVSYIVNSIHLILKDQFHLKQGFANNSKINETVHKLQILDPATGTGIFLYAVVTKIFEEFDKNKKKWSNYVKNDLLPRIQGFELLLTAYLVTHLKLSLQLQEYGYHFEDNEQLPIFLTNTLDKVYKNSVNSNSESPIMVILGNPPYSYDSVNKGTWISQLIRDYYQIDGKPLNERNPKGLQDDYVKFIRFAQWRIQQTGDGILGFVTNHGYLDNPTFRGMRQSLMRDFDEIYVLDLHGNSKKKERSPDGSVDKNIFDIQQGVAIGIFIKYRVHQAATAKVYHAHLYGDRPTKYQWLSANTVKTTQWTALKPQSPFYLFTPQNVDLLSEYQQFWKITEIMPLNSVGIVTARDHLTIQHSVEKVLAVVNDFSQLPVEEARTKYQLGEDVRDWKVHFAQNDLKQYPIDKSKVAPILYRPFDKRFTYYTGQENGFICRPRKNVMQHLFSQENLGLAVGRAGQSVSSEEWDIVFCADSITDMNLFRRGGHNLFPLYLYPTEKDEFIRGSHNKQALCRKPNFSSEFIKKVENSLKWSFISEMPPHFPLAEIGEYVSALDLFHYLYATFHSPFYRKRYAEFLKIDFPRLPLTHDQRLFRQLADLGEQLVKVHLMKTEMENDGHFPIAGTNIVEKIVYQDERVYINKKQYFDKVTPEIWEFHIGGYQLCQKWLKDRKGQVLDFTDCSHYLFLLTAIKKTSALMTAIDVILCKMINSFNFLD